MIPSRLRKAIAHQDHHVLQEIKELVDHLVSKQCQESGDNASDDRTDRDHDLSGRRVLMEDRNEEGITYRLEMVSCGKGCKGCPHGPYWYGYWKEGGKTRSKYIGKVLKKATDSEK